MNIAVIGTGNVGSALAQKWAAAGHSINLGVRSIDNFKGKDLLQDDRIRVWTIPVAVTRSEVILLATPAPLAVAVARSLGNTSQKIIIDAMNVVGGNGPEGFPNTSDAILSNTSTDDVIKCFNTTGYNNMLDPVYDGVAIDMFVAGNSKKGKEVAIELALDAGFGQCYDVGGNDKFSLMEQFAGFWINLAIFQGEGREIGFKLLKR